MRVPRIYTHQPLAQGSELRLDAGSSQHLLRALRLKAGAHITLFNGTGGEYDAEILSAEKKSVLARVGKHQSNDLSSPLRIHLGIAVSRGDRMDLIVQKATELGAAAITPLFSERTEVKLTGERATKKIKHWQQIAISACEQSGRNRVPEISVFEQLRDWLASTGEQRKFVLHHRSEAGQLSGDTPGSLALLIGPEGGLSEREIDAAVTAGFETLRLGPRVLRTETAPLAAISIFQARWGDMA